MVEMVELNSSCEEDEEDEEMPPLEDADSTEL